MKTLKSTAEAVTTEKISSGVKPKLPPPMEFTPLSLAGSVKKSLPSPRNMPRRSDLTVKKSSPEMFRKMKVSDPTAKPVHFKRDSVDALAYLHDDMELFAKIIRETNTSSLIRFERSHHLRDRQIERKIRTREIFDAIAEPKAFIFQKERVWKVVGQNGISILVAFTGVTGSGKSRLLGLTVYPESSNEDFTYKEWVRNSSNMKKLTKNKKVFPLDNHEMCD